MTRRRPLVAANWKMNGVLSSIRPLLASVVDSLGGGGDAEVVICPPYVYLAELAERLAPTVIDLGAQNVAHEPEGAFTGEVSAVMLRDFSCRYVIIGHSERRVLYGETDDVIAAKFMRAREAGLTPILCLGERMEERRAGATRAVVERQLNAVVKAVGIAAFSDAVIAYEPVWAIGAGVAARPGQAQEVHAFLRSLLAAADAATAASMRIIYGGSVKAANAEELFSMTDIDGGLIGGASLKGRQFVDICRAAVINERCD